jgi:hypothetical protein
MKTKNEKLEMKTEIPSEVSELLVQPLPELTSSPSISIIG